MIFILYYTLKEVPKEERINGAICGVVDATITFYALYWLYFSLVRGLII